MNMPLGEYDNDNFALINILIKSDEETNIKTKLHESIHMLLSLQTRWGCFEYYLNHIARLIDYSYNYIFEFIHMHSLDVQESVAELWEKLYVYMHSDKKTFLSDIKRDKYKNPVIYSYLEKFLPILEKNKKLKVEKLAFLIYRTAIYSMNGNIEGIPLDNWNISFLKTKFDEDKTPNKVLKKKLIELEEALGNDNEDMITVFWNSLHTDWDSTDIEYSSKKIKQLTLYILEICKKSKNFVEIEMYLSTIRPKYVDLDKLDENIIPTSFTQYNYIKDRNSIQSRAAILFVFGNYSDFLYTLKSKLYKEISIHFSNKYIMLAYFDYANKTICGEHYTISKFDKVIKKSCYPIVISYKAFENNISLVKKLNYSRNNYYVYCDRPYATAKFTIEEMCKDKYYAFMEFNNFDVICVKLYVNGLLFVPVVAGENFLRDCDDKFYSGRVKEMSSTIFKDKSVEDELNLIINCLYQI